MKIRNILLFILLFFITSDSFNYIASWGLGKSYFTTISLFAKYFNLIFLLYISGKSNLITDLPNSISILFKLLIGWNLVTILHGAISANDYWDWKFLLFNSALFLLIPLAFFIGRNLNYAFQTFQFTIKYLFLFGLIFIPITFATSADLYTRLMVPVSLFIIFIPYLKPSRKLLIFIVAIISILIYFEMRINIFKILASTMIISTYIFRNFIKTYFLKFILIILFITPIVLLFLASFGQFNIFEKMSESEGIEYTSTQGKGYQDNMNSDTRTFLYVEVLKTLVNEKKLITGMGGTAKYKSDFFDFGDRRGRYGSEVGFLNVLLYSGIIGIVIYVLILYFTAYFGISQSNNWLCKMLGLYIALRWITFFFEDYTQFDLNFYFLWITIGLLSNRQFRALNDTDIKSYFTF